MSPSFTSKKEIVIGVITGLIISVFVFGLGLFDKNTKIVFCDVGQGDAIYIRIKNRTDVLIDAGPDGKVLSCLGKHMPFYDRKIELAIISHPQKDHYYGFIPLFTRYQIGAMILLKPDSPTPTFNQLLTTMKRKNTKILSPLVLNSILIGNTKLSQLNHWIGKANNINDDSLVFLFQENDFKALFTGDVDSYTLDLLSNKFKAIINKIDILKIPHHGSKTSLSPIFLQLADPQLAVITVGRNNSYGHPSHEVLDLLKALKIKTLRTDEKGDIILKIQ